MGWRKTFRKHQTNRAEGALPEPLRWRPRVRIFGLVTGAIGGVGTVVLIQQYGIAPLTQRLGRRGFVGGILSGVLVPSAIWAIVVFVHNRRLARASARTGGRGPRRTVPAPGAMALLLLVPMACAFAVLLAAPRAGAEIIGPCIGVANGRDIRDLRVDPDDALKLTRDGVLTVTLGSPRDVQSGEIGVQYAGRTFVIASGDADEPVDESGTGGEITLDFAVDDVAWLGGGLYEFYGGATLADGTSCTGAFLFDVDVDPLETLMGVAAASATAVGVIGLIGMSTSGIIEGATYLRDLQSVVVDLDGDGVPDATAFDHDQDGRLDTFGVDTDADGRIDQVAWDSDADGVIDRDSTAWDTDLDQVPDDSFDSTATGATEPETPPIEDLEGEPPETPPIEDLEGEPPATPPIEDLEGEPPTPLQPPVPPPPPPPPTVGTGPVGADLTLVPPVPDAAAPSASAAGDAVDSDAMFPTETRTHDELWRSAQDKINQANNVRDVALDTSEYLEWLERFEAENPGATPQQILTALHADKYPEDIRANFPAPLSDVPLFQWGPETQGWESARDKLANFTRHSPQFIDTGGERIDIAHIYAGPRAGLDRTGLSDLAATIANTHAGDLYQVVFESADKFPLDQYRGNNIGLGLAMFYGNGANANVPLSEALRGLLRPSTFIDPDALPSGPRIEPFPEP